MNSNKIRASAVHAFSSHGHNSLSPHRQPSLPYDKPQKNPVSGNFIRHRRIGSLNFKPRNNLRVTQQQPIIQKLNYSNIQSPSNTNNSALIQKYCRAARTEKPTPLISPRMSTMKSLILTEIYSSKPLNLNKSISHHQQTLGQTAVIKSGRLIDEMRHGSTGCALTRQQQKMLSPSSTRARWAKEIVLTPHKENQAKKQEESKNFIQEGINSMQNQNFSRAIELFGQAISVAPKNNPEAYFRRGIALLDLNAAGNSIKVFFLNKNIGLIKSG